MRCGLPRTMLELCRVCECEKVLAVSVLALSWRRIRFESRARRAKVELQMKDR